MALFSLTGRSSVRNSIPMLDRMQRASEYLHKGMDQLPNGFNEKSSANLGGAAEGMLRKAGGAACFPALVYDSARSMAPFLHDTVGKRAMLRVHDAILADHRRGTVGMLRISWDGIGLWMVH
jgi:hypothetical protein